MKYAAAAGLLTGWAAYALVALDLETTTTRYRDRLTLMNERLRTIGPERARRVADPTAAALSSTYVHGATPELKRNEGWNGSLRAISRHVSDPDSRAVPISLDNVRRRLRGALGLPPKTAHDEAHDEPKPPRSE